MLLVVARLYGKTSEHATHDWLQTNVFPCTDPDVQHLYRTLDLLGDHKTEIEQRLLEALDRLSHFDTVFYDLTSTYFGGDGPMFAKFGYSPDNRPDREEAVIGVATANKVPITHHVWPDNTADKATLEHVLANFNDRFDIDGATFIADRGLMAPDNLDVLEAEGWNYIIATNRHGDNDIVELITLAVPGSEDQRACVVKETDEKRYLLCLTTTPRTSDLQNVAAKTDEMEADLEDLAEHYGTPRPDGGAP